MKILLATDGSAHSQAAIDLLNRVSFPPGSEVTLLGVLELPVAYVTGTKQREPIRELEEPIRQETKEILEPSGDHEAATRSPALARASVYESRESVA